MRTTVRLLFRAKSVESLQQQVPVRSVDVTSGRCMSDKSGILGDIEAEFENFDRVINDKDRDVTADKLAALNGSNSE